MRDSHMTAGGSGGNKMVILLLFGGVLLLSVTGILIFRRNSDPEPKAEAPKIDEQPMAVKTLVVPQRPRPLWKDINTDISQDTASSETKKQKKKREAVGTIDSKAVNSYVNAHFGQVKACYERRLKVNSFLEGKLDLNIVVTPSGKASAITVNSDTVRDQEILDCVKTTIRAWEFPKPEGGRVVIAKTFSFKKKDS